MEKLKKPVRVSILIIAGLLVFVYSFAAHGAETLRQTIYGEISGKEDAASTWAWLGIPYAKPPSGGLRWKTPQDPDAWGGVKETTAFCSQCPQYINTGEIIGNEDCLYLNIWRPRSQESNLPVYFWIHGGGNSKGAASDPGFEGANISSRSNMVVVTIN
jgi:para-nitrobenzyl esterase